MRGLEHLLGGAADHDLPAERFDPCELEVGQVLLRPPLGERA
jgi:hypothetical protein